MKLSDGFKDGVDMFVSIVAVLGMLLICLVLGLLFR